MVVVGRLEAGNRAVEPLPVEGKRLDSHVEPAAERPNWTNRVAPTAVAAAEVAFHDGEGENEDDDGYDPSIREEVLVVLVLVVDHGADVQS